MAKAVRDIVRIDEELCDGCGDCILSCAEGAIQIIDGKARLVADNLCDGFGNCLGVCPRGAITIEKRSAEAFDETAVSPQTVPSLPNPVPISVRPAAPHGGGCPGSAVRMFGSGKSESSLRPVDGASLPSELTQWPVQLMLVPPTAPFFQGREILLAADCCAFASGDFHRRFLAGKALLVGCPKLDDLNHYRHKLEAVFRDSGCTGVTVLIMEVPCCGGLRMAALEAFRASGADFPLTEIVLSIRGEVLRQGKLV